MTVTNTDSVSDPHPPTRKITVNAPQPSGPPAGTITTPASDVTVYQGYATSFEGSGTDPKGETLTGKWDFGDDTTGTGFSVSHTFINTGAYTVTFTVTNTDAVSDPHPPKRTVTVISYGYGY